MVSPKAQATRIPITGLLTEGDAQAVLVDLPGLLDPAYALQRSLRRLALEALPTVDLILHLHPAPEAPAPAFSTEVPEAPPFRAPVLPVYTKGDLLTPAERASLEAGHLVTSVEDRGSIARLAAAILDRLPVGPFLHDPDDVGTQPVRFFVGEYLREAAFDRLEEELPYAIAVEVDEFREERRPIYIRATLYVERESQKGIVIGRGGATLKALGTQARQRIEHLLGEPVYLETRVKVLPKWRRSATALTRFGFPAPGEDSD